MPVDLFFYRDPEEIEKVGTTTPATATPVCGC